MHKTTLIYPRKSALYFKTKIILIFKFPAICSAILAFFFVNVELNFMGDVIYGKNICESDESYILEFRS